MNVEAQFLTELKTQGVLVERNGDKLRIIAPKGTLTPELMRRITESKGALLAALDGTETEGRWRGHDAPADGKWLSEDEWKARMLNRIFDTQGTSKWPSRITAATVAHGRKEQAQSRRVCEWQDILSTAKKSDNSDNFETSTLPAMRCDCRIPETGPTTTDISDITDPAMRPAVARRDATRVASATGGNDAEQVQQAV